jgi:hypothetical protein
MSAFWSCDDHGEESEAVQHILAQCERDKERWYIENGYQKYAISSYEHKWFTPEQWEKRCADIKKKKADAKKRNDKARQDREWGRMIRSGKYILTEV